MLIKVARKIGAAVNSFTFLAFLKNFFGWE
jgi:hypothetical protein